MDEHELQLTRRDIIVALLQSRLREPVGDIVSDAEVVLMWVRWGSVLKSANFDGDNNRDAETA